MTAVRTLRAGLLACMAFTSLAIASTGAATGSTTDTPTLTAPAEGSTSGSPITITYTLPEAARPGATLAFTTSSGT